MAFRAARGLGSWLAAALLAGCSGSGGEGEPPGIPPPSFSGNPPNGTGNPAQQPGVPNVSGGQAQGGTTGNTTPGGANPTGMMEGTGAVPLVPPEQMTGTPMPGGPGSNAEPPALENVLVFTRTTGYRHDAIGAGVEVLRTLGSANGFSVEQTEDAAKFSDAGLAPFDVVVFLSTTGDVLDAAQQAAFERYIRAGGGWVGVHSASDTEYDWAWYGQLLGNAAFFQSHPAIQTAVVKLEANAHPSTRHLPASFSFQDELYNFRANPRSAVTVLMTLDESSYAPGDGAMGADHPIAWYHEFDGGRAWYTGLGHRIELYRSDADPVRQEAFTRFTEHVLGGIRWAAGVAP